MATFIELSEVGTKPGTSDRATRPVWVNMDKILMIVRVADKTLLECDNSRSIIKVAETPEEIAAKLSPGLRPL